MTYQELLKQLESKNYVSAFTEAQRKMEWKFSLKLRKDIKIQEIINIDNPIVGEKIKLDNENVFVHRVEENLIAIIYKKNDNIYQKEIQLKVKNDYTKILYKEVIQLKKSLWGIERMFFKKMYKREMKKAKKIMIKKFA